MAEVTTNTPASAAAPADRAAPSAARTWSQLSKARLSALVLLTAAAGYVVAPAAEGDAAWWPRLGFTCLGTGLAAASAAMLNQVAERRRDALMRRTAARPIPAGHVDAKLVFAVAVVLGYAGCAVLLWKATALAAALAGLNILLYVVLYTPLKPRTTLNTLVGAVTGAIPPVIGWTAVTGTMAPGAWSLFGVLFVWQIPHFLALAWLYRADYEAGGFAMLPSRDPSGAATAQACVLSSLMLVPVGLLCTLTGVAGIAYAAVALAGGLWLAGLSARFLRERSDARARKLFLASLAYLPVVLGAMVLDRGSVVPTATQGEGARVIEVPGP
ncbi:MAG: heme o synthase [Planctomycetota bacterium]